MEQLYWFRVSQLAHFAFCWKRARIEIFNSPPFDASSTTSVMAKGTAMHADYSCPYKSFDRRLLRYQLEKKFGKVFQRQVDNIIIRGIPDDFKILWYVQRGVKYVSLEEVKTTMKKRMWISETDSAVFQLQLYIWLLRPYIEQLGWKVWKRHWVIVYSQRNGKIIRRIPVYEDPNIEDKIKWILRVFQGLEPIKYPPLFVCKSCPRNIKLTCGRWIASHENR